MIIGEITGLFLIPFGANLGGEVWDLLNATKLIFVPFLIALVTETFDARAQGADEGSAAVLALKRVELKALAMFACLLLFVMPSPGMPTYNLKQYSCSAQPSMVGDANNVVDLAPTNGISGGGVTYAQRDVSVLVGLINDFGVTLSNVLTGSLPCKQGATVNDVTKSLERIKPQNESHRESLAAFAQQCYIPAQDRHAASAADGTLLFDALDYADPVYQKAYSLFMSSDYEKIYDGRHVSPELSDLMIDTGNYWFDSAERNKTLYCVDVARSLHQKNEEVISNALKLARIGAPGSDYHQNYDGTNDYELRAVTDFFRLYSPNATPFIIERDLSHYLMVQAYNSKLSGVEGVTLDDETVTGRASWHIAAIKDMSAGQSIDREFGTLDPLVSLGVYTGAFISTYSEGIKAYAGAIYIPIISTLLMCLVLAIFPLVVVISGYSYKIAWGLVVFYFGLALVPFWMNVGVVMSSLMASYTASGDSQTYALQQEVIGYIFIYTSPVLWMAFIQSVGGVASGAFGNIANSSISSMPKDAMAAAKAIHQGQAGTKKALGAKGFFPDKNAAKGADDAAGG